VQIARTFKEGDDIAGFEVVHLPGHSPGLVGLYRESDGVALTSDAFYTIDVVSLRKGAPRIPHAAFTPDYETARASLRKLADIRPSSAWPGHADPVRGDVRAELLKAADG
jgi:glyoxylase-like metal-dependent hydrolase (beta-lactamase superfamily II)